MPTVYLDTSGLGRILLGEPDAPAILRALGSYEQRVSSRFARVELRRVALRHGRLGGAEQLLSGVALLPLDDAVPAAAERVAPASAGTLDALHLVTALRLAAAGRLDALLTYDARMADGARRHGLSVVAPA